MNRQPFIEWADKEHVVKCLPLHNLSGRIVGIDAAYFLRTLGPEGVLSALGGSPISLGARITALVTKLQDAGLSLHFVFDGLDYGMKNDAFATAAASTRAVSEGFALYDASSSDEANRIFKHAAPQNPAVLIRTCQKTLYKLGVPFSVAPYSALAQLAYYEKDPRQFVDAIYGPPELFCFGVDKIIYQFEYPSETAAQDSSASKDLEPLFYWIDRKQCLERLGNISPQLFSDALMISGSSLLAPFPPFVNQAAYKAKPSIREAVDALNAAGGSVSRLCARNSDPAIKKGYLDQYKRAFAGVKHHIIITAEGDLVPLDKEHAPGDIYEFIGLRLPEELYMYLCRAVIQPQVLNWITSGSIYITSPSAGDDSKVAQNLARTPLDPLRRIALTILAEPIHRYYQGKEITTKLWFDKENEIKFTSKSIQPSPREALSKWHVTSALLDEAKGEASPPGSLAFALSTLSNGEFACRTITPKPKMTAEILKTSQEVATNAIWRLLQLRGYVDEKHELTHWGRVLHKAMASVGQSQELQEAVMIGVELLRFNALSADTFFPFYAGAPLNGTDIDKRNCMLVSRVACLGKIRHKEHPYSGPLSRHLTAYQAMASSVRNILRDLLEMNLASMLLDASVDRNQKDWMALSLALPFYEEHSCALGILTLHYLDELSNREKPESPETRDEVKEVARGWIKGSFCDESLRDAFQLWDAIYQAVKTAGDDVSNVGMWDEVNQWLSNRK